MTFFTSLLIILFNPGAGFLNPATADQAGKTDTLKIWKTKADKISADPLGQLYILSSGILVKYNPQGDSAFSWSDPQTGPITMIDTGDPMRILVYQKDFNLLRFLNNRLSPLSGPIRLDDLGLTAPMAFTVSSQGGFWVLDGTTFRIRYLDQQLKPVVESAPLNLPVGIDTPGFRMTESGDRILLLIPGQEIRVFDLFANLIRKIPVKVESFTTIGNRILLVYPDRLMLWKDPVSTEETLFRNSGDAIRDAWVFQNKLLFMTSDRVILMNR